MNRLSAVAVLTAVLALGCEQPSRNEPIPASDTPSSGRRPSDLLPVVLPDMSGMAPQVREQLRARNDLLSGKSTAATTSKADLAAAYGALGNLLLAANFFAEAEPCYLNAYVLAPDDFRWRYYLAHAYRLDGELGKATAFFERALEARPDDVATLVWLGDLYLDQGRSDAAAPLFSKALAIQPRAAAAHFGLGRIALDRHDYAGATEHLERALQIDPRASVVHYPLAMAYRASGRLEQAEAHLRQRGDAEIVRPDPLMQEIATLLQSSVAFESRGDRAMATGEFAAAVTHFRRGLDLAPENVALRQKLATALSLSGDLPGALKEFQDVLRRSPDFAPTHYSLGVLLLADGQLDLAIQQFSTAVQSDPTYVQARLQLANTLRRRRRFDAASREYATIIMADPRIGEARFGQAVALTGLKRYADARDSLLEAIQLFPDRSEFVGALARLLAAAPDVHVRDGSRARALAEKLVNRQKTPDALEAMAMALAEVGEFEMAARWQRDAIKTAEDSGHHELAVRMLDNLRLYERRLPSRAVWRDDPSWDPS
jgi:tetratricopeptide (TPR) repeat protein